MADSATMSDRTPVLRAGSGTWSGRVDKIFGSLAVRHGIKFGLAGVLSVFIALFLRLPEPTWALTTAFVIMFAQFVGAVAEKSVMRLIGTAAGGVIGYLLTASLEQQPILYLLLVGGVVGFGTAMFGYTKYPYAFLLCALTTMVVASNGMNNPSFSWKPALERIEEVSVGVISAVIITSLIWPRYARKEFLEKMRLALGELRKGLAARSALLFRESSEIIDLNDRSFANAVAGLQNLLHFGAMESQYFRARLPTFTEIISCLNRISAAVETLVQTLPQEAVFRRQLRVELEAAHAATADCLGVFADADADSSRRASAISEMNTRRVQWREKLHALRKTDVPASIPVEQVLQFSGHALSIDEVAQQLGNLNGLLDSLPANPLQPSREAAPPPSPPLDPFWIRNGVKACIAVTLGLFVQNWLKPPGGSMIVLATWVFTVLSRLVLRRPRRPSGIPLRRLHSLRRASLRCCNAVPNAGPFGLSYLQYAALRGPLSVRLPHAGGPGSLFWHAGYTARNGRHLGVECPAACDFPIHHGCVLWRRHGVGLVRFGSEVAMACASSVGNSRPRA